MINKTLAGEVRAALDGNQFEKTGSGLYFPKPRAFARGEYFHSVNGGPVTIDSNLLTDEGLQHFLMVTLGATAKKTAWYLALYAGNYTPVNGLTMASFASTASEFTSTTEGYTGSTRKTWTPGTVGTDYLDNLASEASFTIATASNIVVYGAALVSDNTRGGTSGVLVSATKFAAARTLYDADNFSLGYRVSLATA